MTQKCDLTEGLESVFRTIHEERMVGLPILNPALQVQAVGFCELNDRWAGVLITPWFMNLLLLPPEGDTFADAGVGDKHAVSFPSGPCEMEVCEEELLGRYLSRPLYSPMGEFASQQQALTTAETIMKKMMAPAKPSQHQPPPEPARRALLRGLFSASRE